MTNSEVYQQTRKRGSSNLLVNMGIQHPAFAGMTNYAKQSLFHLLFWVFQHPANEQLSEPLQWVTYLELNRTSEDDQYFGASNVIDKIEFQGSNL